MAATDEDALYTITICTSPYSNDRHKQFTCQNSYTSDHNILAS